MAATGPRVHPRLRRCHMERSSTCGVCGEHHAQPTIVLVHGAFSDRRRGTASSRGLHKDGYTTVTPALALHGVGSDVAIVRSTLDAIAGPKILVGHSYGGFVVSNASAGRSDVAGIVYTAAFVPDARRDHQRPRRRLRAARFPRTTIPSRTPALRPGRPRRHRPRALPRRLRPGPEPEAGGDPRRDPDADEPGHPVHPVRVRSGGTRSPAGTPSPATTGSSTRPCSGPWPPAPTRPW